jgi:hypothetical protein
MPSTNRKALLTTCVSLLASLWVNITWQPEFLTRHSSSTDDTDDAGSTVRVSEHRQADQKQQILDCTCCVQCVLRSNQVIGGSQDTRLKLTIDHCLSCVTSTSWLLEEHSVTETMKAILVSLHFPYRYHELNTERLFVDDNSHATERFETMLGV